MLRCNAKIGIAEYLKFLLQINNCSSTEASLALSTVSDFLENASSVGSLELTSQVNSDPNHEEIQKKTVETEKAEKN